jgi:hypothetical protein
MMAKRKTLHKFSRLTEEECSHVWANTPIPPKMYCVLCGKAQTPEKWAEKSST